MSAVAIAIAAALVIGPVGAPAQTGAPPSMDTSAAPPQRAVHWLAVGAIQRSYRVGDTTIAEQAATVSYMLSTSRVRVSVDGTLLRYALPGYSLRGVAPAGGRFDFLLRPGDTLSVTVRAASRPRTLDSAQTAALGSAGTSTVDLESFALGTPAVAGVNLSFSLPVGDLVLGIRGGVDLEPRPTNVSTVYWRGTTLLGGLELTGDAGDTRLSAGVDASRSSADSLGGRNLFPGGGSVTVRGTAEAPLGNPFDPLGDEMFARAVVFYAKPFGEPRVDQPNRLIPVGNFTGVLGSLLLPVGDALVSPSVTLLRESSSASYTGQLVRQSSSASSWTASFGLDATLPLRSGLDLTPQVGYTTGNINASFSDTVIRRRGRPVTAVRSFSDPVRGWWAGLELSASF